MGETLAERVKGLRQALGWRQITLAHKSGIPQATISRIESGTIAQPKMGQLWKLANGFGITIDHLVGR